MYTQTDRKRRVERRRRKAKKERQTEKRKGETGKPGVNPVDSAMGQNSFTD